MYGVSSLDTKTVASILNMMFLLWWSARGYGYRMKTLLRKTLGQHYNDHIQRGSRQSHAIREIAIQLTHKHAQALLYFVWTHAQF
jgi:hypothetical protein